MPVGCCDHHRQRGAASVYHKMAFCARFATIRADASGVRIRPGMRPLFAAGMLWESTVARLQSSWQASPRRQEQHFVDPLPDAGLIPVAQTAPAGHATAAAELLGQQLLSTKGCR